MVWVRNGPAVNSAGTNVAAADSGAGSISKVGGGTNSGAKCGKNLLLCLPNFFVVPPIGQSAGGKVRAQ